MGLVNKRTNIHSVLSPLCRLHLTWQLPALQHIPFQPQASRTQQRESPVLFFISKPTQLPAMATLDVLSQRGWNFQKPGLHQIFQLSLYFCTVGMRNSKEREFAMWATHAEFVVALQSNMCTLFYTHESAWLDLVWLNRSAQRCRVLISTVFAIHYFMRNLS